MNRENNARVVHACAVLMALATAAPAGDLNPPAGPVTGTMKTLSEVEPRTPIGALPYTISQPGSYYLIKDLTGAPGQHGITIAAGGVTLDMCGFTIRGTASSLDGIHVSGSQSKIHIENGTLCGWGGGGINTGSGMKVMMAMVKSEDNEYGACGGTDTSVMYMMADGNRTGGILLGDKCTCYDSTVCGNTGPGIQVGSDSIVTRCASSNNTSDGIRAGVASTLAECTASGNGGNGILIPGGPVGRGSTLTSCTAADNMGSGIVGGSGSTLTGCTVSGNSVDGIAVSIGATVVHCTTRANGNDGIEAGADCHLLNNNCAGNGPGVADGAGIHVITPGGGTRVDSNNCVNNDRNFDVDSAGNLIVRNSSAGTGVGFDIAPTNAVGAIVNVAGNGAFTAQAWANLQF
jgi:hypothetical protein